MIITETPLLRYIALKFKHFSLMDNEIILHYSDYLNEDGSFDGKALGEAIAAIFDGMEKEVANPGSVPDGTGLDYLRARGAWKIQNMRRYEREKEDDNE